MYTCTFCDGLTYNSPQLFYKHLIEHKSKHSCKKCGKIIKSRKSRRQHGRKHTRVTCTICNTVYEKLNKDEHLRSHEYLYSIDQLNGIVDIINQIQDCEPPPEKLNKSEITQYRGTKPNCPVKMCKRKFENQNELIDHFIHHRENHLCTFCGEIFPDDASYESHAVDRVCRAYSCDECGKQFSIYGFIRHITSECKNNLFGNTEVEPMQTYNTRKIYRIYDEIQYCVTCFVCEEEFETMELLNKHLQTHNKKLNICPKCFCVFHTNLELQDHATIGCENTEELPGEIHEKLTKELAEFQENHAKNTNHLVTNKKLYEMLDGSFLFQCNVCESKFIKFTYLREHSAKYNHEFILCYKCLYLFNSFKDLRKHLCVVVENSSSDELKFRKKLQKCFKRNRAQVEITSDNETSSKKDKIKSLYNNDDIVKRMTVLINQLGDVEFNNIKDSGIFKETPGTSVVRNSNDDYDLNKILPRILERRNKRLFRKPNLDEDSEEELEVVGNDLQDLDICKKHLLIENRENDLDKVLPRIVKLQNNKRHNDETIGNIDKFLEDLGSPQNQEAEEPPNKRNRSDELENSVDYLEKIELMIKTCEKSDNKPKEN